MKLGTARFVMFVAGAIAALLLARAHVRVSNGSLASALIVAALVATVWPRRLSLAVALGSAVITPIYVLASIATIDFGGDPEEVSYTTPAHLGLIAIACAMLGVAAIVVRIATRPRLGEHAGELG